MQVDHQRPTGDVGAGGRIEQEGGASLGLEAEAGKPRQASDDIDPGAGGVDDDVGWIDTGARFHAQAAAVLRNGAHLLAGADCAAAGLQRRGAGRQHLAGVDIHGVRLIGAAASGFGGNGGNQRVEFGRRQAAHAGHQCLQFIGQLVDRGAVASPADMQEFFYWLISGILVRTG